MFCEKCGKEIEDDAVFCPYCGETVSGTTEEKTEMVMPSEVERKTVHMLAGAAQESPNEKVRKQKGVVAALVAACVVLLGGIITGVVFLVKGNNTDKNNITDKNGELTQEEEYAAETASGDGYSITVYDAMLRETASGVQIKVYDEAGNEVANGVTDENGQFTPDIQADGMYNISCEKDGYYTDSVTKNFTKESAGEVIPVVPVTEGNGAYVLLSWDSQDDLDLCLFNASSEEVVRAGNTSDVEGNCIYGEGDGALPFELIYMTDLTRDTVKSVYVLDYSTVKGEESDLSSVLGSVRVYTAEGLKIQKLIDETVKASLWIPCYFYAGQVYEDGQVITALPDWALKDKEDVAVEVVEETTEEEVEEAPAWMQLYYNYVVGIQTSYNYDYDEPSDYFALVDLDKDGVPELAHSYLPNSYRPGITEISTVKDGMFKENIVHGESCGRSGALQEAIDFISFYDGGSIKFTCHDLGDEMNAYSLISGQWVHTATMTQNCGVGAASPFHYVITYDDHLTGEHLEEHNHVYVNGVEITENEFDWEMPYEERMDDFGIETKYASHLHGNFMEVEWMDKNALLSYLTGLMEEYSQQEEARRPGAYTDTSKITEAQVTAALNDRLGNMIRYYAHYATPAAVVNRINGNENCREEFPDAGIFGVNSGEGMFAYFPFELVSEEFSEYISESNLKAYNYFETGSETIRGTPSFKRNGENYYYFGDNGTGGFCDFTNELGDIEIVDIDGERYTVRFKYRLKQYDYGSDEFVLVASKMIYITVKLDSRSKVNGARFESARME